MKKRRRERGRRGGRKGVFSFSLFNVTSSAARNCSPLYPPLSSPFPSLTPLRHPGRPQLPPPLRVDRVGHELKKKSKAVDTFLRTKDSRSTRSWGKGKPRTGRGKVRASGCVRRAQTTRIRKTGGASTRSLNNWDPCNSGAWRANGSRRQGKAMGRAGPWPGMVGSRIWRMTRPCAHTSRS